MDVLEAEQDCLSQGKGFRARVFSHAEARLQLSSPVAVKRGFLFFRHVPSFPKLSNQISSYSLQNSSCNHLSVYVIAISLNSSFSLCVLLSCYLALVPTNSIDVEYRLYFI